MTRLLAFDTSTPALTMALVVSSGASVPQVSVYEGEGGAQASAQLLAQAQHLMDQAGLTWNQLDAIAFGRGPGAFTGLRTACSVAQGLALGADLPVLPLDTLRVVAEDAHMHMLAASSPAVPSVWVAVDARMGEIYAAHYQRRTEPASALTGLDEGTPADGGWSLQTAPLLTTPEGLLNRWLSNPPPVIAGNALAVFASAWAAHPLVQSSLCFPTACPSAQALARVAWQSWAEGLAVDAALALPLYVRDKVAQTTAEREARVGQSDGGSSRPEGVGS